MPHLVQMDKKYSKKGMVLIGAEVQGSASEAIEKAVDDHKIKFTVTKGVSGPRLSGGIPHMAVFGVDGNLVYHGHPSNPDTEKAIKTALKDVKEGDLSGSAESLGTDPFAKPKYLVNERTWTNADGRKLVAALISLEGVKGKFRFRNGRQFEYDISKLSADDQELIKTKTGTEPEEEEEEEEEEKDENRFDF
ncbi:MAG TPA: hypothetical protein DCE22_08115 [Verrucomicrobiales bacterium]|nr:hypothetical protein [Verrucomicrobiales bacterium]